MHKRKHTDLASETATARSTDSTADKIEAAETHDIDTSAQDDASTPRGQLLAFNVVPDLMDKWSDEFKEMTFDAFDALLQTALRIWQGEPSTDEFEEGVRAAKTLTASGLNIHKPSVRQITQLKMQAARSRLNPGETQHATSPAFDAARAAFQAPFVGPGLRLFQNALEKYCAVRCAYHREILVLQSSGSGKSRLVTEALRSNLGILLNVRHDEAVGYPHCDEGVAFELLRSTQDRSRPLGVALVVCAVLAYLTQRLQAEFEKRNDYTSACAAIAARLVAGEIERAEEIVWIVQKCQTLRTESEHWIKSKEGYKAEYSLPPTPDGEEKHRRHLTIDPLLQREEIVMQHSTPFNIPY